MGYTPVVCLLLLKLAVFGSCEKSKDFFTTARCPPVSEGSAMILTFYTENPLDISQELFFNLRKNAGSDLISCYQESSVPAECDVFSDGIETKGVVNNKLTITISNASKGIEGTYQLTVFSSDTKYNPVHCSVRITKEEDDKTGHHGTGRDISAIIAAVVISCVLCFIIACVILFVWRRSRRGQGYQPQSEKKWNTAPHLVLIESGDDIHEHTPVEAEIIALLAKNEQNHDEAGRKQFDESTSFDNSCEDIDKLKKKEKELLLDKGPGSFCIRNNPLDPAYDVLLVNHQGAVQIFPIRKEENSVVMEATKLSFKSVSDLVIHYREHEIRTSRDGTEDDVFGKLKIDLTQDLEKHHEKDKQQTGIFSSQSADSSVDPKYFPAKDDRGAWGKYNDSKIGSAVDPKCVTFKDVRGAWDGNSDSKLGSAVDPKCVPAKDDRDAWVEISDSTLLKRQNPSKVDISTLPSISTPEESPGTSKSAQDNHDEDINPDSKISAGCENPQTYRPSSSSKREVTTPDPKSPKADQNKEDLTTDAKPWYFKDVKSRSDERKLLLGNDTGSFLIRPNWNDSNETLAVNFYGMCKQFTIVRDGKKVVLRDTGQSFNSHSDLVKYHKENAIQTGKNTSFGKLIRPCTRVVEKSKGVVDKAETEV